MCEPGPFSLLFLFSFPFLLFLYFGTTGATGAKPGWVGVKLAPSLVPHIGKRKLGDHGCRRRHRRSTSRPGPLQDRAYLAAAGSRRQPDVGRADGRARTMGVAVHGALAIGSPCRTASARAFA
mgnify:CR=1 FL=1